MQTVPAVGSPEQMLVTFQQPLRFIVQDKSLDWKIYQFDEALAPYLTDGYRIAHVQYHIGEGIHFQDSDNRSESRGMHLFACVLFERHSGYPGASSGDGARPRLGRHGTDQ
ncbi:hypothetical protein [Hymenobacter jeollabukensis]|uniref:Uncharacterized protein n=1 Tax=Hymenobacter jeollabukensis TaxID=2025313 RepID=A0A5R8WUM9_9BACT|nr:hypothetical protein [Hymenobacter jeollabukensis]TLM95166.1 hypothetical protein FDY95_05065 [Hymenobacter jeollabukensis]